MNAPTVKLPPRFQVQQIALVVPEPGRAFGLLADLGLTEWYNDHVVAKGVVFGLECENAANLSFNYQAGSGAEGIGENELKPLELEILDYVGEENWISSQSLDRTVSHLGTHCTAEQLAEYRAYFASQNIEVAQEVVTQSHTNPGIANSRRYNYVIFNTRPILGVDLKFIVRLNVDGTPL